MEPTLWVDLSGSQHSTTSRSVYPEYIHLSDIWKHSFLVIDYRPKDSIRRVSPCFICVYNLKQPDGPPLLATNMMFLPRGFYTPSLLVVWFACVDTQENSHTVNDSLQFKGIINICVLSTE